MHSKKSLFLVGNLLIVASITIVVLIVHPWLARAIDHPAGRIVLLTLLAIALYLFLSGGLTQTLEEEERRLKELVDETLHELNTPIATIEANLKMLTRSCDDPKAKRRLARIQGACTNLSELYESIEYDIKRNINHLPEERFDVAQIVRESVAKFEDIRGDIEIRTDLEPLTIIADRRGFSRVCDNLLSNAIKYNRPEGSVVITLHERVLQISDSGRGIDTRRLFDIFERTFQERPESQGYGLGLTIVKNYCDRYRIKIAIETHKERGTTFRLDLSAPHSSVSRI